MKPVLDYIKFSDVPIFKFEKNIIGQYFLQIGYEYQPWDTNTGKEYGSVVILYKNATESDIEMFKQYYDV